jgi:hypothetical protein
MQFEGSDTPDQRERQWLRRRLATRASPGSVAKNAQVCGVDDIASLQPLQPCMPFGVDDDGPLIQVLFLEWVT